MEFQETVMRYVVHKPQQIDWGFEKDTEKGRIKETTPTTTPRRKWKLMYLFNRFSSSPPRNPKSKDPPNEFLCPISGSLMAEPVIVTSGHTLENACVLACKALSFTPTLEEDSSTPDFSTVISNLALKTAILNWCKFHCVDQPKPIDPINAKNLVRALMEIENKNPGTQIVISEKNLVQGARESPTVNLNDPELTHSCSSSVDSVETAPSTPSLQLVIHPSYNNNNNNNNSSSSSSSDTLNPGFNEEEEEMLVKLKSPQVFDIERAVISLRQITRSTESSRVRLCTPRILSALRSLIMSRYSTIQVNTVAALVNLSLEDINKVKIVRSGMVPLLIDVLKGGFPEAQEHASGALFSLALDDDNKTAIGVLGALEPLMHMLRSENERTRHDSVIALYHLSLVKSNRVRLVKLGSVPVLLGMVKPGHMAGRIMLVLGNLAWCPDGRAAMLDAGAVECLVKYLGDTRLNSESSKESCLSVLYGLSQGGLRFRVLAKAVEMEVVLSKMVKEGSKCVREKAMTMLEMMKMTSKEYEEEEMADWEDLLELRGHTQCQSE
ncbi:U-box domain-containing protein 40-like [Castanea sativa]|uniref:U-box domain-containing protein 40-like n=1 Tax=Castanea sativa TaxID=21020 RepID=UPI003F6539DD